MYIYIYIHESFFFYSIHNFHPCLMNSSRGRDLDVNWGAVESSSISSAKILIQDYLLPRHPSIISPKETLMMTAALECILLELFPDMPTGLVIISYKELSLPNGNTVCQLLCKSWCPVHRRTHSQQHWCINQYSNNPSYSYIKCFDGGDVIRVWRLPVG